jgi:hypothetical protein
MVRTLGLFLLVFSVLSGLIHLTGIGLLFATGALSLFVIDQLMLQFTSPRPTRTRGEPLL